MLKVICSLLLEYVRPGDAKVTSDQITQAELSKTIDIPFVAHEGMKIIFEQLADSVTDTEAEHEMAKNCDADNTFEPIICPVF
jgi:hypothetical protein